MVNNFGLLSRRTFLKQTVAFSALAASGVSNTAVLPNSGDPSIEFLVVGDWGWTNASAYLASLCTRQRQAAQREADHQQRMSDYQAEQKRKEEERKAEFERQQKEYEAEQVKREKQRKARVATFERIVERAPATFNAAQTRTFLRLLIRMEPYSYLEEVASHFANGDENTQQSDDEIVLAALESTADEKLNSLALRIVLTDHIGIPHENQPDLLTEAEVVFAPKPDKKRKRSTPKKPTPIKAAAKLVKKATAPKPKKAAA